MEEIRGATDLRLMMLLTICSASGATNCSGRPWSRQNFMATVSGESPALISICSTHPSSISTAMASRTRCGSSSDSFSFGGNRTELDIIVARRRRLLHLQWTPITTVYILWCKEFVREIYLFVNKDVAELEQEAFYNLPADGWHCR